MNALASFQATTVWPAWERGYEFNAPTIFHLGGGLYIGIRSQIYWSCANVIEVQPFP